jgi:endogenous inhibitor of DNA gyrase (YacG/DUF329 family)
MFLADPEKRIKCPRCGTFTEWDDNPYRPFCSSRCRAVDLGAWVDEEYRVAADSGPEKDVSSLSENHEKTTEWS